MFCVFGVSKGYLLKILFVFTAAGVKDVAKMRPKSGTTRQWFNGFYLGAMQEIKDLS